MTVPTTNKPWPPPPDLHSINELVAEADVESFIAEGSPADEYEGEAEALHAAIASWPTADLTSEKLLPVLRQIWAEAFELDAAKLSEREPKLAGLAAQIARFFGPEATPLVRGQA